MCPWILAIDRQNVACENTRQTIQHPYAPTFDCNEENIDMFYDNLDMAKAQCKSQEIITVRGDLNAKVGSEGGSDMVGKDGLGM